MVQIKLYSRIVCYRQKSISRTFEIPQTSVWVPILNVTLNGVYHLCKSKTQFANHPRTDSLICRLGNGSPIFSFSTPLSYLWCSLTPFSWTIMLILFLISTWQIMNIRSIYNHCEARAGNGSPWKCSYLDHLLGLDFGASYLSTIRSRPCNSEGHCGGLERTGG